MNPRALIAAIALFTSGLLLFRFASGHVRGFGGDVLIVVGLVSVLATLRIGTPRTRVLGVLAFAVVTECVQGLGLVGRDSHWLWHLTLGSTFDPLDLLAYVGGAVAAMGAEWLWRASSSDASPAHREERE